MVYATNTALCCVFTFVTLPAYKAFDVWAFVPLFTLPSTLALLFLFFRLPETKGREVREATRSDCKIHEIVAELMRKERDEEFDRRKEVKLNNADSTFTNARSESSASTCETFMRL